MNSRRLPAGLITVSLFAAAAAFAWDDFMVITTDFATYGGVSLVDRHDPWHADVDAATVSSDAVGRWHDGLYYVVNRGAANIQVLDPAQGLATLRQFSVGAGRNPQDIAFAPDGTAYVSCYDEAVFLQVDVVAGVVLDSWSTVAFADADGLPETSWMQAVGGLIYLTSQRLDRNDWWNPAGGSRLLVFDTNAGDWLDAVPGTPGIDGIMLSGQDPWAMPRLSPDGAGLLVSTVGRWAVADAGLETIDLAAMQSGGLVVTEQELGGEILGFVVLDDTHGWCVVSDASFVTHLKTFDPSGGAAATVVSAGGYDFVDVAWDGEGLIYLCDRTYGAAGVRVFDAWSGGELTTSPVTVGRPPFMSVLPLESGATAAPGPAPAPLALRAPWPNPANPRASFSFTAFPGERVRMDVCDLRGRRLRSLAASADADGEGAHVFDGLDRAGRPLPSGSYLVVIRGSGGEASRSFTLVR
ncbi:hypothetical protein KKG45_01525 [bacterium]|nr:hypothetical protein [bacterium]